MRAPNAQYNVAAPTSLAVRVATAARLKMYERFVQKFHPDACHSILDVGVTSDQTYSSSNYFEYCHPFKDRITAVGIDDASFLREQYPGVKFCRANGCALPFLDGSFDFVHSSAVIEHVGGAEQQRIFLRELLRVARLGIFVTTPNRWFPIEFHTLLPFFHWLPKATFRTLLRIAGDDFFSKESNLNLLSRNSLLQLLPDCEKVRTNVDSIKLIGWPSNLLLSIKKTTADCDHVSN